MKERRVNNMYKILLIILLTVGCTSNPIQLKEVFDITTCPMPTIENRRDTNKWTTNDKLMYNNAIHHCAKYFKCLDKLTLKPKTNYFGTCDKISQVKGYFK